ncbi:MAG TPA: amidohydrolase family protein [Candidatus Angelobacter sp.]|nr:amidohydrolase family protein [Candidatus Angelobacter sp.]
MIRFGGGLLRVAAVVVLSALLQAGSVNQLPTSSVEKGSLTLHLLLHPIGEENYEVVRDDAGGMVMNTSFEYSDRGRKRTVTSVLRMQQDFTPANLSVKSKNSPTSTTENSAEIRSGTATIREAETKQEIALPQRFFVGFGSSPFSLQMMMLRYWKNHGEPTRLPILRANAHTQEAEIRLAGHDSLLVDGKKVPLTRYTVGNIVFGREVVWLNEQSQLAALMTFGGGLPFEAIRKEYEPSLSQLVHSGVEQEMKDLEELGKQAPPEQTGNFAIAGATLVDGIGGAPVADSVVIVRNGRIAAAGPRNSTPIPSGMKVVNAGGKTLLPGLWEMHTHFSGVEFGPALLAAGITTARDCGGEFEFLTTERDQIEKRHALGPRLLLAGLVDGGGLDAFGAVSADTVEQAHEVVEKYKAAGFQQLKLYTLLKPEIVKALSAEAHRAGMSVTGHVPAALNAIQGVEDGMDQINHLGFVTPVLRSSGEDGHLDLNSETATNAVRFFQQHHTVIDPTISWGEMAGHSKDMEIASFEPGIAKAPYMISSKFLGMGAPAADGDKFRARMEESRAIIAALHKAGIPIVAGSDTGLIGYGLDREIELYVQSGMTPLEAIQTATIVPARAMNLEKDTGSIEVGKRADLILVDGNPLENISDIRKVWKVITDGRMYSSAKLWESVGFLP